MPYNPPDSNSEALKARRQEELLALEHLQSELIKLRSRSEQLAAENVALKQELRKGHSVADFKQGEIAMSKVAYENVSAGDLKHLEDEEDV